MTAAERTALVLTIAHGIAKGAFFVAVVAGGSAFGLYLGVLWTS